MPGEKLVSLLFGVLPLFLSLFLPVDGWSKENKALSGTGSAARGSAGGSAPFIIVLDPGHGGPDRGSSGRLGRKRVDEKDISLGIAIRTKRFLEDEKFSRVLGRRVTVLLTRDRDREVSLEARSEMARAKKADLFVSIHSNSESSGTAHGVETYFLNNTSQESDSKLEEIENRTSKKYAGRAASALVIRSIAADAVVDASRLAAESLHKSLVDHLRLRLGKVHDRGVKQAMLYVLLDAQVPAVLFEAFFLSHKGDLALLTDASGRQDIAEGLAKGILRYLATL